jgi:Flp pilus assembly pilin Flp
MRRFLTGFLAEEHGSAAVEYGALVLFIGLSLVLVLDAIGLGLGKTFTAHQSIFLSSGAAGVAN